MVHGIDSVETMSESRTILNFETAFQTVCSQTQAAPRELRLVCLKTKDSFLPFSLLHGCTQVGNFFLTMNSLIPVKFP